MNKIEQRILERIEQLEEKAKRVKATHRPNPPGIVGGQTIDVDIFNEWKVGVENLVVKITGENSPYYKNLEKRVQYATMGEVDSGIGILRGLKEDIEQGFLASVKELVKAEVFTDFLEIACHLLDNNYKDPAASLIGAVLENGLKDIAVKNSISVSKRAGIDEINKKLASNNIYNALVKNQVDGWRIIRNSADHGNFNEYNIDDVKGMKSGVENFLANHL